MTLIFHANVLLKFWVDVFLTATYLINRLPLSSLGKNSPYFKLFGQYPNYSSLCIFCSLCFPHLKTPSMHKFSKKTKPCAFLGYNPLHKGYRCLDPILNRVYISRHVVFNEACFPFIENESSYSYNLSITTFPNLDEWFSGTSRKQLKSSQLGDPLSHQSLTKPSTKAHQIDLDDSPQDSIPFLYQISTSSSHFREPTQSQSPTQPYPPTNTTQDHDPIDITLHASPLHQQP